MRRPARTRELLAAQRFELVERSRPVAFEQARECTVSQQLAARLARRTVVGFTVGEDDALDWIAADREGLSVFSVRRHLRSKSRHLLWEAVAVLRDQALHPLGRDLSRRGVEALHLLIGQALCPNQRRELRAMEDLVGVGIADTAEDAWIRQRALLEIERG